MNRPLHPRQFEQFVADTNEHGGATTHMVTGKAPQEGFLVGRPGLGRKIPADKFSPRAVVGFAAMRSEVLEQPENFIGSWKPAGFVMSEGPQVHLDVAEHEPDLDRAIRKGYARRELAIGEFRNGQYHGDINLVVQRGAEALRKNGIEPKRVVYRDGEDPFRERR